MESKFEVVNIFTGQHHSLFEDVKHLIPKIHYFLPIGEYNHLSLLYSDLIKQLYIVLNEIKPDMVVVQGDTASAYCASFCAFTMGIKVGHVEAGLRTYDLKSPFPEEFNRQAITDILPRLKRVGFLVKQQPP
jgi:UDP-N-acetylglucosamine 2-epimerase (non-hydrolysing)